MFDELLQRLAYVAKSLRSVRDPRPDGVSRPLEHWAADAITRFLAGECSTLDEAFGLVVKRKPGAKRKRETIELARQVHSLREDGETFDAIAEKIGRSRNRCQQLYDQHRTVVELMEDLVPKLHDANWGKPLARAPRSRK